MSIYREYFTDVEDIISNFCIEESVLEGVEILFAEYDQPGWEGYAWVLYRKDGQLFEVNGSHCSCSGLEGQWEPTLTTVKALFMMPRVQEDEELRNLLHSLEN